MLQKKLWIFPLMFGIIGSLVGLILRYAFTGSISAFPFKNFLHSHSHVMLLGFIFNGLLIMVWKYFTEGIDKWSYRYYLILQGCVLAMLVAFLIEGYAFYSILFSTIHLWISYVLLIRLWKRIKENNTLTQFVKFGIIFHFISSLGPYILGPLMIMEMQNSPWYQQAIFFYLHFQYFGVFFVWMLAILFNNSKLILSKNSSFVIITCLVLLFTHSLDYSFDHYAINIIGIVASLFLFLVLLKLKKDLFHVQKKYNVLYGIILLIAFLNIIGSIPVVANLVVESRFLLIAWLHLIFLGMYVPFIWMYFKKKINSITWSIYAFFVVMTEVCLVFPGSISKVSAISLMWLLFISYLGVFVSISMVHFQLIFDHNNRNTNLIEDSQII
ncbi:MAG: hypothetical protein KJO83_08570 [Bacteroidia bacterium]|nr:hypothetical protein [Bacteroidia bacterium]